MGVPTGYGIPSPHPRSLPLLLSKMKTKVQMTTETKMKTIPEDLLAFKQLLLDDLVKTIEQHQPVTIRRWLKPSEAMHMLGVSRHKLNTLRELGTIVSRKIGDNYSYEYESVVRFNAFSEARLHMSGVHPEGSALPDLPGEAGLQRSRADGAQPSSAFDCGPSTVDRGLSPQLYAGAEAEVAETQNQER